MMKTHQVSRLPAPAPAKSAALKGDSETLSPQQLETLAHLGAGLTREEAAARTDTCCLTVDKRRAEVKRKLGVQGEGELVRCAIRLKLVGTDVKLREREMTEREREVVSLLGEGLDHASIARKLGITVRTVVAHRANLSTKLEALTLADLVRWAIAKGLASRP